MDVNAKKKKQIIEAVMDDSIFNDSGVNTMSFVDMPAMEMNYIYMGEAMSTEKFELAVISTEKRIVVGPAMIPRKEILRRDKKTKELYYVYFSEETIRKCAEKFLKTSAHVNANVQHKIPVNGAFAVESWIVENPELDKAKAYGFNVPKGTWMVSYKVENEDLWNNIKLGNLNGFSVEGYFMYKMAEKMSLVNAEDVLREIVMQAKSFDDLFDELDKWFNENSH
jgi:hypothetical protein